MMIQKKVQDELDSKCWIFFSTKFKIK